MQTITQRLYYTSLDARFTPCSKEKAVFQMEEYTTDKGNAFAISTYTGHFSYSIGQHVDTVPRVDVRTGLCLTNVIKNTYLNALSNNRAI